MTTRRVLTRAERQAQTRGDLLDAAAQLFFADGYYATSLAAVAAAAGRTIGAVYSNFASKEELCREVLKERYAAEVSNLMAGLAGADDTVEARQQALSAWWVRMSGEHALLILTAEYLLSVLRNPEQRAATVETFERFVETGRVLLEEYLPERTPIVDPPMRDAVNAIVSTGAGLAVGRIAGVIDADESAMLLVATLRMWLQELVESVEIAGHTAVDH